ncbi:T9SS type A sorting domain-containing protein [Edaphocola aurantiacus]|uniref:T9SS type A sorting domain-containing protein n=1 Tax=Edaphocola aurantiacus TaxID=2601682 RepID=UPI001C98C175|nr:T9SS type A sorting domain-containing protein [Edaphocola aurantiacus]
MNKIFSFATLAMLSVGSISHAQIFTNPIADEFTYGNPDMKAPNHISCNSARGVDYDGVPCDLYVSTWGDSEPGTICEFNYQFAKPGTTLMAYQGSFLYKDVTGLSTAIIYDNNYGTRIFVAYYKPGAGHFVDVYDVVSSPSNPVVLNSTVQLSNAHDYGKISMDGLFYAGQLSIVWANPGVGIETRVYGPNGWSAVSTLLSTTTQVAPDVAMRYNGNVQDVYIVFNDNAGNITKLSETWAGLNTPFPALITPNVEDVINPFGAGQKITPAIIDCPDQGAANWAYSISNGVDVFVRSADYAPNPALPVYTFREITTGAAPLNNQPLNASRSYSPALHYGFYNTNSGIINDGITIAWYASNDNTYNGYMGVQMNPNTNNLINAQDYMELPNGFTNSQITENPGIAISKSDLEAVPDYEYAVYYNYDEDKGVYVLHHAFHPWNNNVFKGTKDIKIADNTYPNPFHNEIHTTVTVSEHSPVTLQLLDITGRQIIQKRYNAQKGKNAFTIDGLQNVLAGTYFLNTTVNGKKVNTQIVVKH